MKKVLVGMSGGVDSSVSAAILKGQGYYVEGATLELLEQDNSEAINDARKVAEKLGINHRVIDLHTEFKNKIIDYFVNEYLSGRTPNPCVACNPTIKFGLMLDYAVENGFDFIATGHYAVIEHDEENNIYKLKKSPASKDQSYFLYRLSQYALSKTIFPIGKYEKTYVRELAKKYDLPVAQKGDSQDICFIKNISHADFIENYTGSKCPKGEFVLDTGECVGAHKGIIHYTVGQRKGLGVSWKHPLFVKSIEPKSNSVILTNLQNGLTQKINIKNTNFIIPTQIGEEYTATIKIRSRAKEVACKFFRNNESETTIIFNEPQKFPAPGQSAVLYNQDGCVIGGGIII